MGNDTGINPDIAGTSSIAYVMSIQPNASLTKIGLAAPVSTMVGIVLNVGFYIYLDRAEKKVTLYKSLYV